MPNTVKIEHRVKGRCPTCGLETLYVDERSSGRGGALIACSVIGCPEWDAIETLSRRVEEAEASPRLQGRRKTGG